MNSHKRMQFKGMLPVLLVAAFAVEATVSTSIHCVYDVHHDRYNLSPLVQKSTEPYKVYRGSTTYVAERRSSRPR